MIEILGYILTLVIGISLGLIGAGGSILTVPLLVYLFRLTPFNATSYSLFIVGLTSLFGAFNYYLKGSIKIKSAIAFAIPAFISVIITRTFLMPLVPVTILDIGSFAITKNFMIMIFFSVLMLFSAFKMITDKSLEIEDNQKKDSNKLFVSGLIVGFVTGTVGAGGGFLIIPALVIFLKIQMKSAVGTSLFIISLNSLTGFASDLILGIQFNWIFLLSLSAIAIGGIYLGSFLSKFIKGAQLKPVFGWFVLIMSVFILAKEFKLI
ncbi:MAG: sulfite exporter TauE/SafE family protein [Melioribacteraceae bacterium]